MREKGERVCMKEEKGEEGFLSFWTSHFAPSSARIIENSKNLFATMIYEKTITSFSVIWVHLISARDESATFCTVIVAILSYYVNRFHVVQHAKWHNKRPVSYCLPVKI